VQAGLQEIFFKKFLKAWVDFSIINLTKM